MPIFPSKLRTLIFVLFAVVGCASSDWIWHETPHTPRGEVLLPGGERARAYVKCETRFLSNESCLVALGSLTGPKHQLSHLGSLIGNAVRALPEYENWPLSESFISAVTATLRRPGLRVAPYRFVLLSLQPTIVLLLPVPPNNNASFEVALQPPTHGQSGCAMRGEPCEWLQGLTNRLVYSGPLLNSKGTYWFSPDRPDLGLVAVPDEQALYRFPIEPSATLERDGEFFKFSRR